MVNKCRHKIEYNVLSLILYYRWFFVLTKQCRCKQHIDLQVFFLLFSYLFRTRWVCWMRLCRHRKICFICRPSRFTAPIWPLVMKSNWTFFTACLLYPNFSYNGTWRRRAVSVRNQAEVSKNCFARRSQMFSPLQKGCFASFLFIRGKIINPLTFN